jgi:DDE superfamily endonuclease/Tc5 transposase DNA-binding domain
MSDHFEAERRLHEAIRHKRRYPEASFRWLADQFDLKKDRIHRRWKGIQQSKSARDPTNLKLDRYQDKAFCWYLERLWEFGVPLRHKHMAAAANEILAAAASPGESQPQSVGEHWVSRWLRRHPEFSARREKSIELERQRAMNADQIRDFFDKYKAAVDKYKIKKEDIWNMDETGLRVGVGRGQWVIVPSGQEGRFKDIIGSHGDTEHVSVIEAISAGGIVISPHLVIKGIVIQKRWFAEIKDAEFAVSTSESGYSNDIICFLWLQHWSRLNKRTQKGEYRMLIMDGYESHLSFQFVRYCEMEKVIVLRLPPHTTHFLQPLDVVIFQQWKHWHAEAIDKAVRQGVGQFDRQTFLANVESIRNSTFSRANINSSFRRCGFVPFRPDQVLRQIRVNESLLSEDRPEHLEHTENATPDADLPEIWSSPIRHDRLQQQATVIQDMLRSSVEPPDTPTRTLHRTNVKTFMQTVLARDLVHNRLTNYMWNSQLAQAQQERRKRRNKS